MSEIVNTKNNYTKRTYFKQDYTVSNHYPFLRFELNIFSPGTFWIDGVQVEEMENQ